jgi:pilus assembly protein CpaB
MAIGFATLATYMAMGFLKRQAAVKPVKATIQVVRSIDKVEKEEILSAKQLKKVDLDQNALPKDKDYFTDEKSVEGRRAVESLPPNALITAKNTEPVVPGLAGKIGPGERAMTIKVDEASGVGGFLKPGARVDVMAFMDRGIFNQDPFSQVLLENKKVLAVGQKEDNLPGDKAVIAPTVTLAVTPQEGEELTWASQQGRLSLVLRNPHEKIADKNIEKKKTSGVNAKGSFGWLYEKPKPKPETSQVPIRTVEVIRGLDRNIAKVP